MIVYRSTRYRIYPTPEQEARIRRWQDALRWLWNLAHEQRLMGLARPKDERIFVTYLDQQAELPALRAAAPWLADVPNAACARVLRELDRAWERCFKKVAGQPRWKRRAGNSWLFAPDATRFTVDDGAVRFQKLGSILAVTHRRPPGEPRTCFIANDVGQWFAVVLSRLEIVAPAPSVLPAVGIDRGVVNIIADSNGRVVENPRYDDRMQGRIAKAQRDVARKFEAAKADGRRPDGANIRKGRERVAKLYRKVRRQRDHLLQVQSTHYAEQYGTIVLEKLAIVSMSASAKGTAEKPGRNVRQKSGLNRGIRSAAWGRLAVLTMRKAEERGGRVLEVPAAYSSQTCSACGHVAAENRRSQTAFLCVVCGHAEHADINAAKVILARGLAGNLAAPKAPKKTLRVLRRKPKATATAAVPAVEACGGDLPVTGPGEAGEPRREARIRSSERRGSLDCVPTAVPLSARLSCQYHAIVCDRRDADGAFVGDANRRIGHSLLDDPRPILQEDPSDRERERERFQRRI